MSKLKLAALIACYVIIAEPAAAARRHHLVPVSPHYAQRPLTGCPTHRAVDGSLVDCHGWRLWTPYGWDTACHNLDYLPSQWACGAHGY
jgi:hypothetical protein